MLNPDWRGALANVRSYDEGRALLALMERQLAPSEWDGWLRRYFPDYTTAPFAEFHAEHWRWAWSIERGRPAPSRVDCWGRGLAKSTSAELTVAALGARGARAYCLYVSDKQNQADDHVANIGAMVESQRFAHAYPLMAEREVGLYGRPRAWRRQRLRTASRFTVDAVGLDTAIRGVKIDADRPDLIVLDDVDDVDDSPGTTAKKVDLITKSLIGAGSGEDLVVLVAQNMVHRDSVVAQLVDGRADFLRGAIMSGPIPAIQGFAAEDTPAGYRITAGVPTWAGFDIGAAQAQLNKMSLAAFRSEYQHEVDLLGGGLFDHLTFAHCAPDAVPELVETTVWVDPAVTTTDASDACAIQVDGWGVDGKLYRLRSFEQRTTPTLVLRQALLWAYEYGASAVGVETDQGRDTWRSVYREALADLLAERPELADRAAPGFKEQQAGVTQQSKAARASQMVPAYEHHRIVHVTGDHDLLERALVRFPLRKPYDLTDAAYWSWRYLWDRYHEGWEAEDTADAYAARLPG